MLRKIVYTQNIYTKFKVNILILLSNFYISSYIFWLVYSKKNNKVFFVCKENLTKKVPTHHTKGLKNK